jgi:uncharacterized protein
VLVGRRRARLEALAENLERVHHVEVEVMAADLLDRDDLARVEARLGTSPEIDLLVNNAGSETEHGPFCQRGIDLLTAEVELNFLTPVRLTHAACQAMPAHGGGNVINVSAGNAFYPTPGAAAYGASKAAINSLTEALAFELRGSGDRHRVLPRLHTDRRTIPARPQGRSGAGISLVGARAGRHRGAPSRQPTEGGRLD